MKFMKRLYQAGRLFVRLGLINTAASLAYYSLFSLVPALLVILFVSKRFVDPEVVANSLLGLISQQVGPAAAGEITAAVQRWTFNSHSLGYTIVSIILLLFTATSVFSTLISAFDSIFQTGENRQFSSSLVRYFKGKLLAVVLLLSIALLLLGSLAANFYLHSVNALRLEQLAQMSFLTITAIDLAIHFVVLTIGFGFLYWLFIERSIRPWRLLHGAVLTALLFIGGKSLLGYYIGSNETVTLYSSAGTLIVILMWTYYSGAILLFGCSYLKVLNDEGEEAVAAGA